MRLSPSSAERQRLSVDDMPGEIATTRRRHEQPGGTGHLVGQSAVATVRAYLFVDPIARHTPTELPCREQDPDLWFSEHPARLEIAKSRCAVCPVRLGCLAGAIARREPWGVWGGEIFERGEIVAQKRARGRPPKRDVAA